MRLRLYIATCLAALIMGGCKDADRAQWRSLGTKHKITVYSLSGDVIRVFHSTGNVSESTETKAWYFEDAETGKLVEFTGQVVIEQE